MASKPAAPPLRALGAASSGVGTGLSELALAWGEANANAWADEDDEETDFSQLGVRPRRPRVVTPRTGFDPLEVWY